MKPEEMTLKASALLPESEIEMKGGDGEPLSLSVGKKRSLRLKSFSFSEESVELSDNSIGEKDFLGNSTVPGGTLEDSELDSPFDLTISPEDISDVQSGNLVDSETGSEGQGKNNMVPDSSGVVLSDSEELPLLRLGKGSGSSGTSKINHDGPPSKAITMIPKVIGKFNPITPLIRKKMNESELQEWLGREAGFLSTFGRFNEEPLKFEGYQERFLYENKERFRCIEKARQVGFSFLFACEAVARCHLREQQTSIFVSYNLEDAKEKIAYSRQLAEELPMNIRKRIITDSKTELGFLSLDGKRISRIISNPSKAPRGRKGDIYLDELAHYTFDRDVYKGSTALIARAKGQLSICSTPLGRRGVFWEVARQELRKYSRYWRQRVPWWRCSFFCNDVGTACQEARRMSTKARVEKFGTMDLQDQFESLALEDFRQEFELDYIDESYSFYPYELILPCTFDEDKLILATDYSQFGKVKGRLIAGFDVGRKHDLSELAIFDDVDGMKRCRFLKSYDKVPFAEQEADLRRMLNVLPIARLSIDQSGIGMHLAENLKHDFPQIEAVAFSNESKEVMAQDFKIILQRRDLMIPKNRELVSQIHSIKRRLTPTGKPAFEVEREAGSKGHADRFWACALACKKERQAIISNEPINVAVRVIG